MAKAGKNGGLSVNSVKAKLDPNSPKLKKLKKDMFVVDSVDEAAGTVTLTGKKNLTGKIIVSVVKK